MIKDFERVNEEDAVLAQQFFLLLSVDDGDRFDSGSQCWQHVLFKIVANHQGALWIKAACFQDRREEVRRPFPPGVMKAVAAEKAIKIGGAVNAAQVGDGEFDQRRHPGVSGRRE